jgi:hypothetical protein
MDYRFLRKELWKKTKIMRQKDDQHDDESHNDYSSKIYTKLVKSLTMR